MADFVALQLAEKHEVRPSAPKMSNFRETLDLKSVSAWDKFSLGLFGVQFEQEEYTALNTLITDSKFYDPKTDTTRGFEMRTFHQCVADSRLLQYSQSVPRYYS